MSKRKALVCQKQDGSLEVMVVRGWTPSHAVCEAPKKEDGTYETDASVIRLEDTVDELTGEPTGKRAVVDADKALARKTRLEERKAEDSWRQLRAQRNALLVQSDFSQLADAPLSDEKKQEFKLYRQQLRDLPAYTDDPDNPSWPTKPVV
jgi:hypothetical protein